MSDVENGDIEAQEEDKMPNGNEAKPDKEEKPIVKTIRFTYSKEELIEISKAPYCKKRPKCLDEDYVNKCGLWDPDIWMNFKNPLKNPTPSNPANGPRDHDQSVPNASSKNIRGPPKRINGDVDKETNLRSKKDPRDRVKEESQDDIVLSPQRRSFGTGCHIVPVRSEPTIQQSSASVQRNSIGKLENNGHQQDRRDDQILHRGDSAARRVGSGRLLGQRDKSTLEWSKARDRDEEMDNRRPNMRYNNSNSNSNHHGNNNSGRYDYDRRSSMNNRRYGHSDRRDRNQEEEEPEWFTGGPTSQHDTIELKGFEEEMPEEDEELLRRYKNQNQNQYFNRQQNRQKSESESLGQNSIPNRNENYVNNHTNSNGVEIHETTGSKESQEFDINEMFKFEGWKNIVNMGPESVTSIPVFTDSAVTTENQSSGGTSRFAQWFNVSRTETESPIDRLLQNATFSSSYNATNSHDSRRSSVQDIEGAIFHHNSSENGPHKIDPAILGLRNHETNNHNVNVHINGNNAEKSDNVNGPVNRGKDLLNLLQKANININDLMQQQSSLPTIKFEHAKSVEEIEADLKASPISGSNQHSEMRHQNGNSENSDFNRLILKAFSNRGNHVNANSSSNREPPPIIPQVMRANHVAGKPFNAMDLLREEDLLVLNQQMIPHENRDPNNMLGHIQVPRGQLAPWLQHKPSTQHGNPPQRPFPNIVSENSDFNRLILKAMTRNNNPSPKPHVIIPQQSVRPPMHLIGKPSSAMDLLKAEDLLALNQQMIPIENRNHTNMSGPLLPGPLAVPRAQLAPWLQSKPPPQHDNMQRYHDNSALQSLINRNIKAKTEEQILQQLQLQQHHHQQQQHQPPQFQVKNKSDYLNGIPSNKTGAGNFSAFTPTSVMRKFASDKDKDAIRRKNMQKSMENN